MGNGENERVTMISALLIWILQISHVASTKSPMKPFFIPRMMLRGMEPKNANYPLK